MKRQVSFEMNRHSAVEFMRTFAAEVSWTERSSLQQEYRRLCGFAWLLKPNRKDPSTAVVAAFGRVGMTWLLSQRQSRDTIIVSIPEIGSRSFLLDLSKLIEESVRRCTGIDCTNRTLYSQGERVRYTLLYTGLDRNWRVMWSILTL